VGDAPLGSGPGGASVRPSRANSAFRLPIAAF
jgi:hypothetical protein